MTDIDRSNSLTDLAHRIKAEHEAAESAQRKTLLHAIACGRLLIEAKDSPQIKHGQWLPWLEQHCRIPERTAQHYMRLAKHESEIRSVADLSQRAAIAAISEIAPDPNDAVMAEGKRLADNVREAERNVLRAIRDKFEELHAFAVEIYKMPVREREQLFRMLRRHPDTKWTTKPNGKRHRTHWRQVTTRWLAFDEEYIAQHLSEVARHNDFVIASDFMQ